MQEQDANGLPEAEEQLEEDNSHDLYLSQCRCTARFLLNSVIEDIFQNRQVYKNSASASSRPKA